MATRNVAPAFVSLADTRARVTPTFDRDAERAASAALGERFGACVDTIAETALARVSQQRARAKTLADTVPPVTVSVPKDQTGVVALAMFHNPVGPDVDAFCDAVTKAIDTRLQALGVDERASVAFLDRSRRKLLVNIGRELSAAQLGAAAAIAPTPAPPPSVATDSKGAITGINLTGIADRLRPHVHCIAACLPAVVRDYPKAQMQEDLGISHERLRAFSVGELFLPPAEARAVLSRVAEAAQDQIYPIKVRGTTGAEIEKLLTALKNDQIFSR